MSRLFGTDGVRGVANEELTPFLAMQLGQAGAYVLTKEKLALAPADMPVLHPLPRIDEIKLDVDNDPRAAYFDQVHNGVYIRMAIILALLGIPDPLTGKTVLN